MDLPKRSHIHKSTPSGVITFRVITQHQSAYFFEVVPVGEDVTVHGLHRDGPCVSDLRDVRGRSRTWGGLMDLFYLRRTEFVRPSIPKSVTPSVRVPERI